MVARDGPAGEGGSEYVVVLRAPSSARFVPEGGWELNLEAIEDLGVGAVRIRAFTRWVADGAAQLPRELVVEVKGRAASLDDAVSKFTLIARPIANMIGFVTNVRVGAPEVHIAYDADPTSDQRELLEVFLADERGAVAQGRIVRVHLLEAAMLASLSLPVDSGRVNRALRQYELALREWYVGGEWLALSHLWMAVEALTEAVLRKTIADRSCTEEDLAKSLGVVTDDPERPRWRQITREKVRENLIFEGDQDVYQTARTASDGLEHGYLELNDVAKHALKCADKTFHYVRRTIIDLLGLPAPVADELMSLTPMDVQSRRKIVRGRMLGSAEDPAEEGELYPVLNWRTSIGSMVRSGSTFEAKGQDHITVRMHPDISFRLERIEVVGRLEEGQVAVELEPQEVLIEPTAGAVSKRLLDEVVPLVDAAAGTGDEQPQSRAHLQAFNLFGQGLAFFQAAQTLIAGFQPVEALPLLRGLTLIAARFEQMADPAGPGLGIVVRMVLDDVDEVVGADDELVRQARTSVAAVIDELGLEVPDHLPDPAETAVYTSLTAEMKLATSSAAATFGTVGLHIERPDEEHMGFHTKLEPGPLTDMIATACVIAQLELLKHAAAMLGWTFDAAKVDRLLTSARELNEASANPPDAR